MQDVSSFARVFDPAERDAAPRSGGVIGRIRLLATTDLHMNLTGFDYTAGRPDRSGGLTRVATLIAAARREAEAEGALTLLFDNGDAMQGVPFGDLAAQNSGFRGHPLMRAFDHLRYDAIGLGNHDFDYGLRPLDAAVRQAPCPVVATNLVAPADGALSACVPYAVLDRIIRSEGREYPIRIGVLSLLPPQTMGWNAHLLKGRVEVDDILDSARRGLENLAEARCDLTVALAHSGIADEHPLPGQENAVVPLAALPGLDVIVAGHTHLAFPGRDHDSTAQVNAELGTVHGKPVVMPGAGGSHLGIVDLKVERPSGGAWRVTASRSEARPVAQRRSSGALDSLAEPHPGLAALLAEDHRAALDNLAEPVGFSPRPLHSYFTFFAQDRALALVAAAQAAALRPMLETGEAADLPLLSAVAPGKYGARAGPQSFTDVPAGRLSLRHVADLLAFPNALHAVIVTGSQLYDWLEMSASLFRRIDPGSDSAELIDPALPGHCFDVIHGISCVIDLSREARYRPDGTLRDAGNRRAVDVTHDGRPVDRGARFIVALNSYRAGGGGHFAALEQAERVTLPEKITVRDALRDYLAGRLPPDPLEDSPRPWAFAPMPGTRVSVQTGPGAAKHLAEVAEQGVTSEGIDDEGFLRLSVPL